MRAATTASSAGVSRGDEGAEGKRPAPAAAAAAAAAAAVVVAAAAAVVGAVR
jgi:hypothetical protein